MERAIAVKDGINRNAESLPRPEHAQTGTQIKAGDAAVFKQDGNLIVNFKKPVPQSRIRREIGKKRLRFLFGRYIAAILIRRNHARYSGIDAFRRNEGRAGLKFDVMAL